MSYFFRTSLVFLSEPAISCLLLAATLVFGHFLDRPLIQWRWRDAILGGAVLGLIVLVRPEEPMLASAMALLAVAAFLFHRYHWRTGWHRRGLLLLVPLVLMGAFSETVRLHNRHSHHLAVQSRQYGPGDVDLLNALYSIPPDRELRYCPVTLATFEKAAPFSPTLKPLLPMLLDPKNRFTVYASGKYEIPGEVCTWLNFLLLDVYGRVYNAGDGEADRAMAQTAREIREAQSKRQLSRRLEYYPVDPLWRLWLPDLPRTLLWGTWNSLALHYDVRTPVSETNARANLLPLTDARNFDDGLLLRTSLNNANQLDVSGVLEKVAQSSKATSVLLRNDRGILAASPVHPFVDVGIPAQFNLVVWPVERMTQVDLEFWDANHSLQSITLPVPSARTLAIDSGSESWNVVVRQDAARVPLAKRIQYALLRVNDLILACGLVVCVGLAACRGRIASKTNWFPLLALVATAAAFVLPRIFFYSLLHVWLDWDSLRYFSANAPATLLGLLSFCGLAGYWVGLRISTAGLRSSKVVRNASEASRGIR
jgi:hypothetical protein